MRFIYTVWAILPSPRGGHQISGRRPITARLKVIHAIAAGETIWVPRRNKHCIHGDWMGRGASGRRWDAVTLVHAADFCDASDVAGQGC
jgi:hypothetical protein